MSTVLIVEDNPTLRESIAFELEMRDYQMLQAEDGRTAIDLLASMETIPDIIVSDIAMPDMDGYALLEHTRNDPRWQNIPFIFLTAFNSKNAIRLGHDLGVDDYLVKPFDPEMLVATIDNKIRRFKQIQQNTLVQQEGIRREFLRMISHELRTPLTSIYGSTEMLSTLLPNVSNDVTAQLLELLRSGTKRMRMLIDRIVSLVQVESGKLREQYETSGMPLGLNEATQKVLETYLEQDEKKRVYFTPDANQAKIKAVRPFIELIINELVMNADTYGNDDSTITIRINSDDGNATFTISDTGWGIEADLLARLQVDLNATTSSYLNGGGIGIGLVLVREIVRIHGGEVHLISDEGIGTTVTLTFPLAK